MASEPPRARACNRRDQIFDDPAIAFDAHDLTLQRLDISDVALAIDDEEAPAKAICYLDRRLLAVNTLGDALAERRQTRG